MLPQIVLIEIALLIVALPLAINRLIVIGTGPIAIALVFIALSRRKQRWLLEWWPVRGEHRHRQRVPAQAAASADPSLAPLLESFPKISTLSVTSRSRDSVGMIGDGGFLTALVHVEPKDEPLRAPRLAHPLPLQVIAEVLAGPATDLASVQVIQHVQPAPATHLPSHALATRAYQSLKVDVPAIRATWLALRLDPEQARSAIEARGGGTIGAQRTLLKSVHTVISELDLNGFEGTPLTEPEVIAAIGAACSINPLVGSQPVNPAARRTQETWRAWRCDDRWHCTFWVRKIPTLKRQTSPDIIAALTSSRALTSTLSLTATAAGAGAIGFSMYVRLSERSENQLAEAVKELEGRARQAGFGLVRLDGEQLPGLLATLPLGGIPA
jgi:type VII secretion protein EccE